MLFKCPKDVDHSVDVVDTNTHLNTEHVRLFETTFLRVVAMATHIPCDALKFLGGCSFLTRNTIWMKTCMTHKRKLSCAPDTR